MENKPHRPTAADFQQSYFDTYYGNYRAQNPSYKLEFYRKTIRIYAPEVGQFLDIGCGLGAWLEYLNQHEVWKLHGTDLSSHAISSNRKRIPEVDFREASATEVPFEKDFFEVITALDVIEHVPDLSEVSKAVRHMLKPSGVFAFVVPVYDGLTRPLIKALDKDPTHVHKEGRQFWLNWLENEGFEVLHWQGILRYLLPGGLYLHHPTKWLRNHCPAIIVIARGR